MLGSLNQRRLAGAGMRPRQRGLTLLELMLTLLITTVLLGIAVPQMRELIARKRLAGVATELVSDMRYARAMLIDRSQPILVRFGTTANQWCYTVFTEGAGTGDFCDCTAAPVCPVVANPPIELKSVYVRNDTGITLTSIPAILRFVQFTGAPGTPFSGPEPVVVAEIQNTLGGMLRVALTGPIRATVCKVTGPFTEFVTCP